MSRADEALVRRGYEAFNRGDIDAFMDLCSPEVEWHDTATVDFGAITGTDAVRAFLEAVIEPWETIRREPEEIHDLGGERFLVLFHTQGRGKESGVEVDARGGDVLDFEEGRLVSWTAYADRARALRAAGLES